MTRCAGCQRERPAERFLLTTHRPKTYLLCADCASDLMANGYPFEPAGPSLSPTPATSSSRVRRVGFPKVTGVGVRLAARLGARL